MQEISLKDNGDVDTTIYNSVFRIHVVLMRYCMLKRECDAMFCQ